MPGSKHRHHAVVEAIADVALSSGFAVQREYPMRRRFPDGTQGGYLHADLHLSRGRAAFLVEAKSELKRTASFAASLRHQCETYRDLSGLPVIVVGPSVPSAFDYGFPAYSVAAFGLLLMGVAA